jgi:hypothetical protein
MVTPRLAFHYYYCSHPVHQSHRAGLTTRRAEMVVPDLAERRSWSAESIFAWSLEQSSFLPRPICYASLLEPHDPARRDVTGHIGTVSRPRGTGCIVVEWRRISDGVSDRGGKPGKNALLRGLAMLCW